ncbi:MAG: hypothetical protein FWG78_01350 [Coriobacteriia bacterium]|nr:hypothetical protein [Coriobacteriia bacterium]
MMDFLSIERVWEDIEFFEIEVVAQSETICAKTQSYTQDSRIDELASRLATFPQSPDDRYLWENGTKGDHSTTCVSLEFSCEDALGHLLIEVYMELEDGGSYETHNCCFYIRTEPDTLNRFGKSLARINERGIGKKATLAPLV